MNVLHLHGNHHLGDTMIAFIFLYNIKDYLEKNNTTVYFYMKNENIIQMEDFKPIIGMKIFNISNKPESSIEIWDCNDWLFESNGRSGRKYSGLSQNRYYVKYFNERFKQLNVPITLNRFFYHDDDLLNKYETLNNKYKNIDILFINSDPLSNQYEYDKNKWKYGIRILNSKYKIVTTKKVDENILCTRDDNLNIKDIAAISIHVKVVIAINTGPLISLFNNYTLMNVKRFYIFDNNVWLNYPNFVMKKYLKDISLNELDNLIFS